MRSAHSGRAYYFLSRSQKSAMSAEEGQSLAGQVEPRRFLQQLLSSSRELMSGVQEPQRPGLPDLSSAGLVLFPGRFLSAAFLATIFVPLATILTTYALAGAQVCAPSCASRARTRVCCSARNRPMRHSCGRRSGWRWRRRG